MSGSSLQLSYNKVTHSAERLLLETLNLFAELLEASCMTFYWVDASQSIHAAASLKVPEGLLAEYFAGKFIYDPMLPRRMIDRRQKIGIVSQLTDYDATSLTTFKDFLRQFDVTDVIDIHLYDGATLFGGIGALKLRRDPPHVGDLGKVDAVRRYVEGRVQMHTERQNCRIDEGLRAKGLTPREREVVAIVMTGASNLQIAMALGITPSTVRTYIFAIFNKLGVVSRTSMVAHIQRLAEIS